MNSTSAIIGTITIAGGVAFGLLVVSLGDRPQRRPQGEILCTKGAPSNANARADRIVVSQGIRIPLAGEHGENDITNASLSVRAAKQGDEALFDKVVQELLAELNVAAGKKDFKLIHQLVNRLRGLNFGKDVTGSKGLHTSIAVKRKVLDALAGGGYDVVDQVIDLLGDSDPEIAKSATELLFETLKDLSLGDYKRAEIVSAAAEEMIDKFALMRLSQEFAKMRPTCARDTLLHISDHGTDPAKELLPNAISALVADPEITTGEQLREVSDDIVDPEDTRPFEPIYIKFESAKSFEL